MSSLPALVPFTPLCDDSRVDRLIAALDHQRVGEGEASWVVQVLGVHVDGRNLWLQVARDDDPSDGVVLHLRPWGTADQARAALASLDWQSASYPRMIHVMQSA